MRGIATKATAPKKKSGALDPRSNKPVAMSIPPKKVPAQNVRNNCNGNCTSKVIQPMKTGRTENRTSPIAIAAPQGATPVASHQHHHRVLDQRLKGADQHGAERAIDRAVVA